MTGWGGVTSTHIMYKNVGFFGSTITRIYDENKNYNERELRSVLLLLLLSCLDKFSFSCVFFFFLENKTNTRAMELGG